MKIEELRIQNFKKFEQKTFKFNPHFTVCIGENAAGKTTILEALAIALGGFLLGIEGADAKNNIQRSQIRTIDIDGQPRLQKPVKIAVTANIEGEIVEWSRDFIGKNPTSNTKKIAALASKKLAISRTPNLSDIERSENEKVCFPVIAYHGTGRLWGGLAEHEKIAYQKQEEGVVMAYTNCLSAKSSSKEFLAWFKTQEDTIKKFERPLDKAHLVAVKKAIKELVPEWEELFFDYKSDALVGLYRSENKTQKLGFAQLSDGFRNMVSLTADIAFRCIQLNPHLGEQAVKLTEGVVLIDEIDLHLHPNWQRKIVADLKRAFPKIQFIATTHSPFIVQSLQSDELINLDTETDLSPQKQSLEEVAEGIMGVPEARRSKIFLDMKKAATEYFTLLEQAKNNPKISKEEIAELKQKMQALTVPFYEDPAFVAFLEFQKAAQMGDKL